MGISDDIKPKSKVVADQKPDLQPPDLETAAPEKSSDAENTEAVEIQIDKSGLNKPVYEDLYPSIPDHPFEHLAKEPVPVEEKPLTAISKEPAKPAHKTFEEHYNSPQNVHKKPVLLIIFIILFVVSLAGLLVWQNIDQVRDVLHLSGKPSSNSSSNSSGQSTNSGVEIISNQDYTNSSSANTSDTSSTSSTSNSPDSSDVSASTAADITANGSSSSTTPTTASPKTTVASTASNVSSLKVSVLNGNGISGSAASVKEALVAAGYTVDRLANAASFNYTTTNIYYNTGKKAEAEAAAKVLSNRTVATYENPAVAKTYDLVVVVGKN